MGVLGLTPFLQKTCPSVIKHLPERFRGLSGKTLVIDGTLITQRFHYAQAPHAYRHVLGWYRLIKELKSSNVSAICVFDGKERNVAKAREAERRREIQRQTSARGVLEQERLKRLRKLTSALHTFSLLEETSKEQSIQILDKLRTLRQNTNLDGLQTTLTNQIKALPNAVQSSNIPFTDAPDSPPHEGDTVLLNNNLENNMTPSPVDVTNVEPSGQWMDPEQPVSNQRPEDDYTYSLNQQWRIHLDDVQPEDLVSVAWSPRETAMGQEVGEAPLSGEKLFEMLQELYLDFQKSISLLASIIAPPRSQLSTPSPDTESDAQAEIMASKAQYQLSIDEGTFWDALLSGHAATATESSRVNLASLSTTSQAMSDSFNRRTNPPTVQTYQECREILDAMGIPCIEPAGAFEGEALASSMVKHGLADYVASEDTDVLVYEAPLVRNLTNRQQPLTIVSGADIRDVLKLDRNSFVDFALLLGTDFSQRIKNVGPARALKFIREYGSIERVIESETKYAPRLPQEEYLQQVGLARSVFRTLPPIPDKEAVSPGIYDQDNVTKVLQRYGLGRALAESSGWDYTAALEGNYFSDDPSIY